MVRSAPLRWLIDVNRRPVLRVYHLGIFSGVFVAAGIAAAAKPVALVKAVPGLFFTVSLLLLGVAVSFLREQPRLVEVCHMTIICGLTVSTNSLVFLNTDHNFRQRLLGVQMLLWKQVPALFGMRLVPSLCVILTSSTSNVVVGALVEMRYGDPYNGRDFVAEIVAACAFASISYYQSLRWADFHELQQDLVAEKHCAESLLSMLCDCRLWLAGDGDQILSADQRFEASFGKVGGDVVGERLSTYLCGGTCERARLAKALSSAQSVPLVLPTDLVGKGGPVRVDLIIVNRLATEAAVGPSADPKKRCYLVCLRTYSLDDNMETSNIQLPNGDAEGCAQGDDHLRQGLTSAETSSLARRATEAGEWASEAAAGAGATPSVSDTQVQNFFEKVARIGRRERWLLPCADLRLLPSRIIGSGGFGVVVAARFHGLTVAVKVPRSASLISDIHSLPSLLNELRVLRWVRHPNVVLFHGACVDPASAEIGLVFEWVKGARLDDFVMPPPATPSPLVRYHIVLGVSCALEYLHSQRPPILHGDLKPSNVLVETLISGARAKLVDFGLSRRLTRRTLALGGTDRWLAPEVIRDPELPLALSSDVFSFGRLAFLAVTGQDPVKGLPADVIVRMAKLGITPSLHWPESEPVPLAAECRILCDRCLKDDPNERPAMAEVRAEAGAWPLPGPDEVFDLDVHGGVSTAAAAAAAATAGGESESSEFVVGLLRAREALEHEAAEAQDEDFDFGSTESAAKEDDKPPGTRAGTLPPAPPPWSPSSGSSRRPASNYDAISL